MSLEEELYDEEVFDEQEMLIDDLEIQQILADYHRRQLVENLAGPGVSLVLHIVFLTLMFIFLVTKPKWREPLIVVEMTEIEEVELEPEVEEEIEEIEEETVEEEAPVTEPSDAPSESVGAEDSLLDFSDDAPMTDDNVDAAELLDVVRTNSPLTYSGPLGGRSNAGRGKLVRKYGGSRRGQTAVNKALRWLARVQNSDGSWSNHHFKQAHTGIALLVFLAHGETPLSEQYGRTVQNAMRWLANYANGTDLRGRAMRRHGGYAHGIATYAICEAYAMTKIPFMQTAMEASIAIIVDGQQGGGGFDYAYAQGPRWDLSVGGWNFQALKAARVAGSTNEKLKGAIQKSIRFCRTKAYKPSAAGFGYGITKEGVVVIGPNMTGVGVVALQLLGAGKSKQVKSAMGTINTSRLEKYREVQQQATKWDKVGGKNLYGWYYDTQAVFNSQHTGQGKKNWAAWRSVFEKVLIRSQNPEGYWETDGTHSIGSSTIAGRVLATCLCALQLEVYYRYLPTFDIRRMDAAAAKVGDAIGDVGGGGLVIEID